MPGKEDAIPGKIDQPAVPSASFVAFWLSGCLWSTEVAKFVSGLARVEKARRVR